MTTETNPHTDADVQLIVTATEQHSIGGQPDADGHDPCSCGQWREGFDGSSWDEHMAEVSLAALTAAGWRHVAPHLLPLLALTADETAALIGAAAADGRGWSASALRSALDKLTTTEEPTNA